MATLYSSSPSRGWFTTLWRLAAYIHTLYLSVYVIIIIIINTSTKSSNLRTFPYIFVIVHIYCIAFKHHHHFIISSFQFRPPFGWHVCPYISIIRCCTYSELNIPFISQNNILYYCQNKLNFYFQPPSARIFWTNFLLVSGHRREFRQVCVLY